MQEVHTVDTFSYVLLYYIFLSKATFKYVNIAILYMYETL